MRAKIGLSEYEIHGTHWENQKQGQDYDLIIQEGKRKIVVNLQAIDFIANGSDWLLEYQRLYLQFMFGMY